MVIWEWEAGEIGCFQQIFPKTDNLSDLKDKSREKMEYLYSEPYNVERKKDGLDSSNQNNHFVISMILITLVGYDMKIQWQMRVCLIPHGG